MLFIHFKCIIGIEFHVVSSRVLDSIKNWTERRTFVIELLLSNFIGHLSIHNEIDQKSWIHAFDYRSLCHSLYIPTHSFVSDDLALIIWIFTARYDIGTELDL